MKRTMNLFFDSFSSEDIQPSFHCVIVTFELCIYACIFLFLSISVSSKVIGPCFAPLACTEDVDDIPMSPSPSLFSMPSFDDVIRRMTSVNQNADTTDPSKYFLCFSLSPSSYSLKKYCLSLSRYLFISSFPYQNLFNVLAIWIYF